MELFERESSLAALEGALQAAREGEGRLALISGEAGIGKTALVEHFTAYHAAQVPIYWGACDALFTPRPLGPFRDIAFGMQPGLLELIQSTPDWHPVATAFLAEWVQRDTPCIVVVEDIHWADEASLDLLKFLSRRIQHTRLLLILTFRDDEPTSRRLLLLTGDLPARLAVRLPLAPLSENTVTRLARQAERSPAGLFAATGGNPFFVTEMIESEAEGIPGSVRDLVLARVARLSPPAQELAGLASLVPGRAELWLLEHVFPALGEALDECVARGLLAPSGDGLAFRHELARQAVAASLPPGRARQLHGQILQAILAQGPQAGALARLVHHAAHAGDREVLLHYGPKAAQEASRLGAHREAAASYQAVLEGVLSLPPETRAGLLEGASFEYYLTGEIQRAFEARRQAVKIWQSLHAAEKEGSSLRWLSRLAWFGGRRADADRYAQAAVEILESLPPGPELAWAYSNKSQLHMLTHANEEARQWGERASRLAEQLGEREIQVHALINLGTAEVRSGHPGGWGRLASALHMALHEEMHDHAARAYANLSSSAVEARRYPQAAAWLAEGLAYMSGRQLDAYHVYLLGWQARLLFETGQWEQAEAVAQQALRLNTGESVIPIPALIVMAHLLVRRGDPGAEEWLEKAHSLVQPTGELHRTAPLAVAYAEAAWWRGNPSEVESAARPAYELALDSQDAWTLGSLAYWLWRAGREDLPLERLPGPYRALLQGEWQAAADEWLALGCPYEQALALSTGDTPARLAALEIFTGLGAQPAVEQLKESLRAQGVKGIPRGPRPSTRQNPAGLTYQETQVLALLAEGLTNAEIAARLSIAKKTADHHISALLRKLHSATRGEAVAAARRQGLLP